jgi:pimeloyl-ACP methyl ester carboxylesterase
MTAPGMVSSSLPNGAAPAVDSAVVRFSHLGERPCPKHPLVFTSDGVRLAVYDTGPRSAEHTVVFLHGLCLNQTSWERQINYLLRRYGESVRVISYDHRGHGRSAAAPMGTYRIDQLADDLAQVLVALHVTGSVTLVGHSMGAMAALAYLGRPAAQRPADAHGLVLVAAAAGKLAERGFGRLLATPAPGALVGLIEHIPGHLQHALVGPVCVTLRRWRGPRHATTLAATIVTALTTTPMATAVGFLPSLRAYNQYATLASIHARTFVISGGADPLTPPSHAADLAAGICGAEHVHVPYAGHMLPQEAPRVINDAIRRTIAQRQRREPVSARPLGMSAMAYPWAVPPKKLNNRSQRSLDDQSSVRLVAGSMTNPV